MASEKTAMLIMKNVSKTFNPGTVNEKQALKGVNLELKKGDFAINSRSDRRGSCGIADRDGSVSLINTILAPRTKMNPDYYNWLFHSTSFADEFYRWGHGIVDDLWTTRWQEMKKIDVPVQPGSLSCESGIFDIKFDKTSTRMITAGCDKTIKMWKEDIEENIDI